MFRKGLIYWKEVSRVADRPDRFLKTDRTEDKEQCRKKQPEQNEFRPVAGNKTVSDSREHRHAAEYEAEYFGFFRSHNPDENKKNARRREERGC